MGAPPCIWTFLSSLIENGSSVFCQFARRGLGDLHALAAGIAPYLVILFLGLLVVTYVPWFTLVLPQVFLK